MSHTVTEALEKLRSEAASLAKKHHRGLERASYEQMKEVAKKRADSLLNQCVPWVKPSDHIEEFVEAYLAEYRNIRDFMNNQINLFGFGSLTNA
jgi:hypothetical protein